MKRILVLAGAGMLGHKVVQRLSRSGHDARWTLRGSTNDPSLAPVPELTGDRAVPDVDVSDIESLFRRLRTIRPEVVINCAGVIKQRETNAADFESVNAEMPRRLAEAARAWGGRVLHISTDCVFSGAKGNYAETDALDATDVYGQSKARGEVLAGNVLVLRTSMIGRELRHHRSLLDWFLAQRGKRIQGYRRAIWSGVTTRHLADLIVTLIDSQPALHGLFHVAGEPVSKYTLLLELRKRYDLDVEIAPDDELVCDRSLDGRRFEQATGYRSPALTTQLDDLVSDPTPYPQLS